LATQYAFDDFTLDLERCALLRGGAEIALRPKSFDVLHYLVRHAGRLVSRQELMEAVWPGLIVTDDSLRQCLAEIRKALDDDQHAVVRTLPRRGYQFMPDVQRIPGDAAVDRPRTTVPASSGTRLNTLFASIGALLALAAGIAWWQLHRDDPAQAAAGAPVSAARASVAVLPFADLSPGGGQEYLADGIAEEILGLLSQVNGLGVIARTSSFAYKGQNVDARTVARELNVSYVLDGSVRVVGNKVRISVQLVDPESGVQLWTGSYEEPLSVETLFEIQDRVAMGVRVALSSRILGSPARGWRRLPAPANIEALNRYLEGQAHLRQIETGTAADWDKSAGLAIERFEASIAADPGWAPAHVALARAHHFAGDGGHLLQAKAHLLDGLRLDPGYAPAYESLGYILHAERDFEGSLRAYQRLGELGSDMTWGRALLLRSLMHFEEAVEEYRKALLRDPLSRLVKYQLAETLLCAERYAEAIEFIGAPREDGPGVAGMATLWAMAKIQLGARSEAMPRVSRVEGRYRQQEPVATADLVLLALAGLSDPAAALLERYETDEDAFPPHLARAALLLGQQERALDILERAADRDPSALLDMRCTPEIRALAGNPRYEAVLERVGFPE
jgi:TolB-like protein/DNA-binding winged helix-turn-helix (wHTH) protein/tetratricopeptide (TPR) repeat protein